MERSRYRGADIDTSSSNQSACGVLGDAETLWIDPLSVAQLDPCYSHYSTRLKNVSLVMRLQASSAKDHNIIAIGTN